MKLTKVLLVIPMEGAKLIPKVGKAADGVDSKSVLQVGWKPVSSDLFCMPMTNKKIPSS